MTESSKKVQAFAATIRQLQRDNILDGIKTSFLIAEKITEIFDAVKEEMKHEVKEEILRDLLSRMAVGQLHKLNEVKQESDCKKKEVLDIPSLQDGYEMSSFVYNQFQKGQIVGKKLESQPKGENYQQSILKQEQKIGRNIEKQKFLAQQVFISSKQSIFGPRQRIAANLISTRVIQTDNEPQNKNDPKMKEHMTVEQNELIITKLKTLTGQIQNIAKEHKKLRQKCTLLEQLTPNVGTPIIVCDWARPQDLTHFDVVNSKVTATIDDAELVGRVGIKNPCNISIKIIRGDVVTFGLKRMRPQAQQEEYIEYNSWGTVSIPNKQEVKVPQLKNADIVTMSITKLISGSITFRVNQKEAFRQHLARLEIGKGNWHPFVTMSRWDSVFMFQQS